jgi:hypothetical protein
MMASKQSGQQMSAPSDRPMFLVISAMMVPFALSVPFVPYS